MSDQDESRRLLVMIARDEAALDELVTGMLDVGMTGATVIDSQGLSAILRQDMPIFAGLAALLPQPSGSRVVISLTRIEVIETLKRFIDEMDPVRRPIAMVLPVEDAFGREPM